MSFELGWIGAGLFIIGLMLFLFLDFKVEKITHYFVNHPTRFEIAVQLMVVALPLGIALSILQRIGTFIPDDIFPGTLILFAMTWPFLMNGIHERINEFAIQLGIDSKDITEIDAVLRSRLIVLGWVLSIITVYIAFVSCQYESLSFLVFPLVTGGMLGITLFPIWRSVSILRGKRKAADENKSNQPV